MCILTLLDPISANDAVMTIVKSQYFATLPNDEQWPAVALELTAPLLRRTRIWSTMVLWTDMIKEVRFHFCNDAILC